MTAWWDNNIKYPDLVAYYRGYEWDKCKYTCFFARVIRWIPNNKAILPESLRWKHNIKTKITNDWRVCTKCLEFKTRDKFSRAKSFKQWYSSQCLDCRNKTKRAYREKTNYSKDHEYKKLKRKLEIWQKIAFYDPVYVDGFPREDIRIVRDYKFKRWYQIQSIHTKLYRRLDINDNVKANKNCTKYYKVTES